MEEDFTTADEAPPPTRSFFERFIPGQNFGEFNRVLFEMLVIRPAYERLLQEMRVREAELNEQCKGREKDRPLCVRGGL